MFQADPGDKQACEMGRKGQKEVRDKNTWWRELKKTIQEFFDTTSIHGLKYTLERGRALLERYINIAIS